jgi:AcrR family transcriptional regulator
MPQQRRAQATRRAITVAAAEEFDRVGYDATPLSAILRRAGVTKGAFYFHYASKEALASALVRFQRRIWARLWRGWKQRELDPLLTVVGAVNASLRILERDVVIRAGTALACRTSSFAVETPETVEWERQIAELLRLSADCGSLRDGVDPNAAARVVQAAVVGVGRLGGQNGGPTMGERAGEVWEVLLEGIASTEWLGNNSRRWWS